MEQPHWRCACRGGDGGGGEGPMTEGQCSFATALCPRSGAAHLARLLCFYVWPGGSLGEDADVHEPMAYITCVQDGIGSIFLLAVLSPGGLVSIFT